MISRLRRVLILTAAVSAIAGWGCTSSRPSGILTVTKVTKQTPSGTTRPSASPSLRPSPAGHTDGDDHPHEEESGASSGSSDVVSFKGDVAPVLKQHCATCHSPGGTAPAHSMWFQADGSPDHANVKDHAGVMIRYIKEGKMPLGKPNSVSAEEIEILENWREAGAPDN